MKKVLCILLCLALLLQGAAAFGVAYTNELALPTHVRALKAKYDEGEYGGEVFQLFARDNFYGAGYIITVSERNDEITALLENTDLYGNVGSFPWSVTKSTVTAEKYQKLSGFVSENKFDSLPDYVNYGEHGDCQTYDYYYTHITPEGISYVQMDDPGESSGVYAELVELMFNDIADYPYSRWYEKNEWAIEDRIRPLKQDYDSGELGSEVYQLTDTHAGPMVSFGPTIIISVKDGQAAITTPERDRRRVLTMDEYQRLVGHIALYDFDNASSVRGDQSSEGTSYSYTHITADGVSYVNMTHPNYQKTYEYAVLVDMFKEFYKKEELEPVSGPLWGELTTPAAPVKLSVNAGKTEFTGRMIGSSVHAELTPGFLNSLGISRVNRPDLDSIVLYRGTKMLIMDRGHSFITEIEASGIDDPKVLAAELLRESVTDEDFIKITPMGTTVVDKRFPLRAVIEAFGGEVSYSAEENSVEIKLSGEEDGLSSEYVNIVVSLMLADNE